MTLFISFQKELKKNVSQEQRILSSNQRTID